MPLNTPARICTHTHHPTPPPPASVPWHPDVSVLLPFSRLQLAPRQLFSPACPPALGTRLIKDEEGPGVGWPGAMRTQPLGPSPPPELPDTCVMSVITGDPPGRPRLAPATQAVNKAGDGVRGTRGCGGSGGASLLPSRKAQLWISGAAETASRLPHRLPNLRFLSQFGSGGDKGGETLIEYLLHAHVAPRAGIATSHFRHRRVRPPDRLLSLSSF